MGAQDQYMSSIGRHARYHCASTRAVHRVPPVLRLTSRCAATWWQLNTTGPICSVSRPPTTLFESFRTDTPQHILSFCRLAPLQTLLQYRDPRHRRFHAAGMRGGDREHLVSRQGVPEHLLPPTHTSIPPVPRHDE